MSRCKVSLLAIYLFWLWPALAAAQNLPLLNMGYSGAGIGSDLLKVIERAGLWRRHGIDVRTIYLSSGSLMAQTMSSGDIGVAGFDTPAMVNVTSFGAISLGGSSPTLRHARESGHPGSFRDDRENNWIPACAGMTNKKIDRRKGTTGK